MGALHRVRASPRDWHGAAVLSSHRPPWAPLARSGLDASSVKGVGCQRQRHGAIIPFTMASMTFDFDPDSDDDLPTPVDPNQPDPLSLAFDPDYPSPQVISAIISHIARGAHRNTAAAAVGIKPTLLKRWLLRGQTDLQRGLNEIVSPFCELYTRCKIAALQHENQMAETWAKSAIKPVIKRTYKHMPVLDEGGNPVIGPDGRPLTIKVIDKEVDEGINIPALAEFMSRRYPKDWGKSNKMELTGKNGGPIETKTESQVRIEQASYPVANLPAEVREELLRQLLPASQGQEE